MAAPNSKREEIFVEQVEAWRDACVQANGGIAQQAAKLQKDLRHKDRELKDLQKELKRKEAALAETSALLVLRKKARRFWGTPRTNDQCLRSQRSHFT